MILGWCNAVVWEQVKLAEQELSGVHWWLNRSGSDDAFRHCFRRFSSREKVHSAGINYEILERLLRQSEMFVKVISPLNPGWALNRLIGEKTYFSNTSKRRQNYSLGQLGRRRVAAELIKQMSLLQLG